MEIPEGGDGADWRSEREMHPSGAEEEEGQGSMGSVVRKRKKDMAAWAVCAEEEEGPNSFGQCGEERYLTRLRGTY